MSTSTTYAPITEVVCASAVAEATSQFNRLIASVPTPVKQTKEIQPAPSFLTPKLCSWIDTPYYPAITNQIEIAETLHLESANNLEFLPEQNTASDCQSEQAYPLEGLDPTKLAPRFLAMAGEAVQLHVHGVIDLLEVGGDAAKTFANIFLNDLALQGTVLAGLMNEAGNPLSGVEFLHKELAMRLAACGAARDVARLLLSEA